jgi:hypothetical protein
MATAPTLKLVDECKIRDLIPRGEPTKRWEASGVLVQDHHFFVVFDDRTEIARFSDDPEPNNTNGLFGMAHAICGYEGITYNAANQRFYLLVLPFVDYSGMSINHGRVAIVSHVNSMLWVGQFNESGWTWRNAGQLYAFPRTDHGTIRYGNIEGVGWVTQTRIVAVSDRRKKKNQSDDGLSEKDQSIHIFNIPSSESP